MKRAYRWRCFACDKPNAASATSCASCGFPARARAAEIDRAQAAHRLGMAPPRGPDPLPRASLGQVAAGWKGWRLGSALAGAVLLVIGLYAAKEVLSWRGLGVAVFALMFGLVLLMVAWSARSVAPRPSL
jgi:hypothetical protein